MIIILLAVGPYLTAQDIPSGFDKIECYLHDIDLELRYATTDNFMGRVVPGYENPTVVLSTQTLVALQKAQKELKVHGFQIKLYDGYRPQKAVTAFMNWTAAQNDTIRKSSYYPNIQKSELFDRGYIARKSGHSRGSTVDISMVIVLVLEKEKKSTWEVPGIFLAPSPGLIAP